MLKANIGPVIVGVVGLVLTVAYAARHAYWFAGMWAFISILWIYRGIKLRHETKSIAGFFQNSPSEPPK